MSGSSRQAFERGQQPYRGKRDPPGRQGESFSIGQDPQSLHRFVVVVQRFAHAHEDDVEGLFAQAERIREHAHLPDDFSRRQVSNRPIFPVRQNAQRHRAADLRRKAERVRRRVGNEDRFDLPAVDEMQQKLLGAVDGALAGRDARGGEREARLPESRAARAAGSSSRSTSMTPCR